MYDFIFLFIIFILVIVLFIYYEKKNNGLIYVKSSLDNKEYLVRNVDDKQDAADLLADIKERISKLLIHMQATYPSDPRVKRLVKKYNPNNISESIEGSKYTSYSLNKGEKIVLCLRSKTKEAKLTDINTLMFVLLHELGHIMTVSIGHTKEFWSNFKFILKNAVEINVYHNVDYSNDPQPYCGIEVNDSPLHNSSIE